MKMKSILSFTFSLLWGGMIAWGQTATPVAKDSIPVIKDTVVPKKDKYGLRVGVDLFKLSRSFYDSNYRGLELTGDFRLSRKHYLAVELGNEKKTVQEDHFNFTTNGSFIRVGFDYNSYENWTGMNNQVYTGLRYGFSSFSQTLNSYSIYYPNSTFPSPLITPNTEFSGLTAHWAEVVAGVKAELFSNFFMGFSFRLNYLISEKKPETFANLYIPGFNRTYEGRFGVGFNYTISYLVPLFKVTVKDAATLEKERKAKEAAKAKKMEAKLAREAKKKR